MEQKLKQLGWVIDVGDPLRQVYRQEPRTQEEKDLLKQISGNNKFPDFIIYSDNTTKSPIAIIETKRPEYKNLNEAKVQGLKYAKALNAKFLFYIMLIDLSFIMSKLKKTYTLTKTN